MNLNEMIHQYLIQCELQNNLNKKTLKAYETDLNQFLDFVSTNVMLEAELEGKTFYEKQKIVEFIRSLNQMNYAVKTIKRKIASLKAFFSYLNYEDIIDLNPFYKIKLKIKEPFILPKIIPLQEIETLFNHIYSLREKLNQNSYRYREVIRDIAVLELLIGTGIRVSELCELKKENISYANHMIKIYGKGAKERTIPIYHPHTLSALHQYENAFSDIMPHVDYFFINKRKNKISDQSIRNMIDKYCEEAHISLHITPHMFRHTFATMLLDNDVDSRNIQIILGHSNITTTQIYTHLSSNKKTEIMKHKNPRSKFIINK